MPEIIGIILYMNKLEESKYFPYIAWTTIILFVFFTYGLVRELSDSTNGNDVQANLNITQ